LLGSLTFAIGGGGEGRRGRGGEGEGAGKERREEGGRGGEGRGGKGRGGGEGWTPIAEKSATPLYIWSFCFAFSLYQWAKI
jgi:hypothetical protein